MYVSGSTVTFTNNTIVGNTSSSYGGGVYVYANNGTVTFTNNTIRGNTSYSSYYPSSSFSYGGGVYVSASSCTVTFTNNTIQGNTSSSYSANPSYGGGLYLVLPAYEQLTGNALYNNLFWNNTSTGGADLWIENNLDGDYVPTPITLLANNFDQTPSTGYKTTLPIGIDPSNRNHLNPLLVDPDNDDFHLSAGSPMIDAGYPSTPDLPDFDIEGTPRVLGASVDIGAYEYDDGSDPKAILTVTKAGNGTATLTSSPTGINCGSDLRPTLYGRHARCPHCHADRRQLHLRRLERG